jgi:hypothetical protein
MLIPNQWAEMKWHSKNKEYYTNLGYKFTKMNDSFKVKVEDLPLQSHAVVKVKCDFCGDIIDVKYQNYQNRGKGSQGYACTNCKHKKAKKSVENIYGVENIFQTDVVQEKIKETCLRVYGVDHYSKSSQFKEIVPSKIRQTMAENGTVPTSSQQLAIYDLLKQRYKDCEINYPCGPCSLDCRVVENDILIDIEYDGSYWHQDMQRDRRRDEYIKSLGYKILRIKSRRDIPAKEELIQAIDCLVKSNHRYLEINI